MSDAPLTRPTADLTGDAWPHTRRVLPWVLAGLLFMIYLVPFDSITLPVHLPVDSTLDRFVLGGAFMIWLAVVLAGHGRPRFRRSPMNLALLIFGAIAVLSLGFNLRPLAWDGELKLALKSFSLLASFIALFYICATTIRPGEVRAYAKLIVGLACVTAIGTIYQYDTGTNPFFSIASTIVGAGNITFGGGSASAAIASDSVSTRFLVTGPTVHSLADATILSAGIPLALAFAASARSRRQALKWLLAVGLLLGANIATGRKTGLLVPVASFLVLLVYEPKKYGRFLPLALIAALAIDVVAPSALSRLAYQISHVSTSSSTQTRVSDFGAVQPYILSHLLIGRGYGSFDPLKYRILDDQMLGLLIEVGLLGTLAYVGIVFAAALTAHRGARSAPENRRIMHGVVAFTVGFFVSNFTYDTFGFRQAPYIFFFMAALAVAETSRQEERPATPEANGQDELPLMLNSQHQSQNLMKPRQKLLTASAALRRQR